MRNAIIEKLLAKSRRTDLPKFAPGDTVKVQVKIREGEKERLQAFEGVVIARSRGAQPSFTVRKISFGQGVERIFPLDSKVIDKIDVVRSAKVRRAKLYYLRGLKGKAADEGSRTTVVQLPVPSTQFLFSCWVLVTEYWVLPLLLRALSSAKMLLSIRVQVHSNIEGFQGRTSLCRHRQTPSAEETSLHPQV